jgi:aminodeoxyfutalosine synthase
MYRSRDLLTIGYLADYVRRQRHGDKAYYVVNVHLNYSNVCFAGCPFCAFGKFQDDPDAFEFTVDEYVERLGQMLWDRVSEVHIVGGLHPDLPFDYYVELVRRIKEAFPQLHIKAFTAVENPVLQRDFGFERAGGFGAVDRGGVGQFCPVVGAEVLSERLHRVPVPAQGIAQSMALCPSGRPRVGAQEQRHAPLRAH